MTIDKRITYRRNFKGGADASMADFGSPSTPGVSSGRTGPGPNVSAGGASFNNLGPGPSGNDYRSSARDFVQTLNNNNAIRANQTGTKFTPYGGVRDSFLQKGIGFTKRNPLQILLSAINPFFGAAMFGANILNKPEFRKRFTGYETQAEYDKARQDRINLKRINTIQNTLDTKYADGDYSMTDLDERLASLQEGLGITPNTEAQNAQQFLDFSNQPELSYEGIESLAQPNVGSFGIMPQRKPVPQYFENVPYKEPDFYLDATADASTTPTAGQYGLNLMQLNTLKNAGYSNSQIEEATERGYAEELVRDIEGPIGTV